VTAGRMPALRYAAVTIEMRWATVERNRCYDQGNLGNYCYIFADISKAHGLVAVCRIPVFLFADLDGPGAHAGRIQHFLHHLEPSAPRYNGRSSSSTTP